MITSPKDITEQVENLNERLANVASDHLGRIKTLQTKLDKYISAWGGGYLGQVITSIVPLTDAGVQLLNGTLIYTDGVYDDFITYLSGLESTYSNLFCTESEWQTTRTKYGSCGKFVLNKTDDTVTSVRLPLVSDIITCTTDTGALAELVEAGLPNVSGWLAGDTFNSGNSTPAKLFWEQSGAMKSELVDATGNVAAHTATGSGYTKKTKISVDASRSNSIYGNSTTVQPQSIKMLVYIVVALEARTTADADISQITSDLNGKLDTAGGTVTGNLILNSPTITTSNSTSTTLSGPTTISFKSFDFTLSSGIDAAGLHNSIYRGEYLGSSLTQTQYEAIRNKSFKDLWIGDYWTINNVNYRIAACNYYLGSGDTVCSTPHLTIVPDNPLYTAQMNTSNVVTGAYVGSAMYKSNINSAKTTISNAFPDHILSIRQYFKNSVNGNVVNGSTWVDASVYLMSEPNVYGCFIFTDYYNGTSWSDGKYGIDNRIYPLFALCPDNIRATPARQWWWLRDVAWSTAFTAVGGYGNSTTRAASNSEGVRPAFNIY